MTKLAAKTVSIRTLFLLSLVLMTLENSAQTADTATGLIQADGWVDVKDNCTECHSAQMIIQNSGSRAVWKSRIVWMQETQGLGDLSGETENAILTYLARHYGQKESGRRNSLPAHLMPKNPLESVN